MAIQVSSETLQLDEGLTRNEALEQAYDLAESDFRGFKYDTKTGKAILTFTHRADIDSKVRLSPGVGFHLQKDGSWKAEKIPADVLHTAIYSGFLTIEGKKCTVFDTSNKEQWAQVSLVTAASNVYVPGYQMVSFASRIAQTYLAGKPEDITSQVTDILQGTQDQDNDYDDAILEYCEALRKTLPDLQEIFDSAFHEAVDFKDALPEIECPKVRQLAEHKVHEIINQAAARIEIISHGLVQELEALIGGLEAGAARMASESPEWEA